MQTRFVLLCVLNCLILVFFLTCTAQKPNTVKKSKPPFPAVQREFRAAWIASVANINWPSKPGLTTQEQKAEALILLNLLVEHNFNAAILQIRPQCDALYSSNLEPWSYYLTGQQGKAPDPYYDPLEFWVEQAHKRGIELHAWLNPYRAHHISGGEVSEASIVKKHPQLVVKLKSGYYWLDPANPKTQDHSYNVVLDIVKRYDIDGIHFDDYFYPYPSYNNNEDFPDDKSWQAYVKQGGELARNDWRRESVNTFIKRLYKGIKEKKVYVKFGLSPFGIWRPHHPQSIRGFDQYDKLYADARLWLNEGWIDYFTPQLYWTVNKIPQSYPVLLGWWEKENKKKRHLWPGMSIGRLQGEKAADETINQIMITRGMLPQSPGNVHWSIGGLLNNDKLARAILKGPYKRQALVPKSTWLDKTAPKAPEAWSEIKDDSLRIKWSHEDFRDVFHWIVYYKYANAWNYKILNHHESSITIPLFVLKNSDIQIEIVNEGMLQPASQIFVAAVDRTGNESAPVKAVISGEFTARDLAIKNIIAHSEIPEINHSFKIEYTANRIQLLKEYAEAHYSGYYKRTRGSLEWPGEKIIPRVIVVHYTAIPTLEATMRLFAADTLQGRPYISKSGKANVGAQFLIDQDGSIHQTMPDNYFARHCIGLNHLAIGIENIALADISEAGLRGESQENSGLTLAQIRSNARLIRYLKKKYPDIEILIGHQEYLQLEDPAHPGYIFFHENDPNYRIKKPDPGDRFLKALRDELQDILKPGTKGQVFK